MSESPSGSHCLICDSEGTCTVIKRSFAKKYRKVLITAVEERYHCNKCGEDFYTPDQLKFASRKMKEAIRDRFGLLRPEQIVEIRGKLCLSQKDLEFLLGLGSKVVTRWENGRVLQTKSSDDILRLMNKIPGIVEELWDLREEDSKRI